MHKKQKQIAIAAFAVVVCLGVIILLITIFGGKEMEVGKRISKESVTDFYYTYASSTNPPDYQRYRFYTENGQYFFYHEKREGDHWPLTENDVTVSGTRELTDAEWDAFFELLRGGKVTKRTESTSTGSAGPWTYLYWEKDRGKFQEYAFPSYGARLGFEEFCKGLQ